MSSDTIDTATAKQMVEVSGVPGAAIIGQPGGWFVVLKLGLQEKYLSAELSDRPQIWSSLDRCVEYLKAELHIVRFELLDATNHRDVARTGKSRKDASEVVDEAAAHDKWFQEQVGAAIAQADDPMAEWVTNQDANDSWVKKRAELVKRAENSGN
jgi:hypothetical protein